MLKLEKCYGDHLIITLYCPVKLTYQQFRESKEAIEKDLKEFERQVDDLHKALMAKWQTQQT